MSAMMGSWRRWNMDQSQAVRVIESCAKVAAVWGKEESGSGSEEENWSGDGKNIYLSYSLFTAPQLRWRHQMRWKE